MEFACGFVYVPPPKDSQQAFKRSALLPPVSWVRPVRAPPPPPLEIKEIKVGESPPKVGQQPHKSKRQGPPASTSAFYDNVDLESNSPKQLTPTRKTALLPPHLRPAASSHSPSSSQPFSYDNGVESPSSWSANNAAVLPEGARLSGNAPGQVTPSAPPLPPRPSLMKYMPEYVVILPTSSTTEKTLLTPPPATPPPATEDKRPLPGNPNVILVSLGKLLSEKVQHTQGKPTSCSQCGSVLDYTYDNLLQAKGCYFCEPPAWSNAPSAGLQHGLFVLSPSENLTRASQPLLIFCIDISASMSITSQVLTGQESIHRSRLEFVQEAVLLCVQKLSEQQPDTPVGLITFNYEVTVHGCGDFPSHVLSGDELTDSENLKAAASVFTTPAPLSYTKKFLQEQVSGLSAVGITALGPAALVAITMASRHPGSKVIICTDGKANTPLGNLEAEDNGARTLLSSTIFYQELGEDAANQGVTVSVLSIEGTDCRLDELGRLADRTGGKVVVVNPGMLQSEFEQIIENNTIATKCTVTLIVPNSLRMRGEKEAGHKAVRKVGNVHLGKEITFQFVANDSDVSPPPSGGTVSIQLQLRYMPKNGQMMLRVFTVTRNVTHESLVALTSLSLPIIQLNSSQASAALAVRGRFLDARRESEQQMKLIERVIEHNRSAEDRQTYKEWVITMEPIYNNIFNFTRAKSVVSDSQSLTDAGAALLYTMKQSNRKTIMIKDHQNLHFSPHWKQSKS
ncbi:circularly permutated Ras protein 1 isoform X2 [Hippocampus comes]|uniref:circularly permutated Ras protein 1 isoform X1 n=1 Tax=Hippocampus comes TaxID=109280 RepID=UPI00094E556B|nr:PREDICTED: circularly permutated Ras protein 1-like isoform X1 [Hippocampus comes]XP_019745417.1 PREDICTED: circularly permutated Ras protein 1-like isoform X1 [Hippocampus comes]XP_019745497.1 PREDICTED: circularly permutated Ras protein 1-like isoform X2 [Hippocampus comes]